MKTEFINVNAYDGALHQGLLFPPPEKTEKAIIHVHGLSGNFYENSFIPVMASKYTEQGWAFLCVNNRGHDYIADIERQDGSSFRGGGAYEKFEECVHDIRGAIEFLQAGGIRRICLQGHSTGCNKIVRAAHGGKLESFRCAALLSPCDDIALIRGEIGAKLEEGLKLAEKLTKEGKGEELLPSDMVFYPMSAAAYLDYYTEGSAHDIFRYREPDSEFPGLKALDMPVLAAYGERDDFMTVSPDEAFRILGEKLRSPDDLTTAAFPEANHNYRGSEAELAEAVSEWLLKTGF